MLSTIVGVLFSIVCILLIIIILLQRGRGGGLSGAFGGAGGHSAFGAKTGDVFTWVTVALVAIYILFAVIANFVFVPEEYKGPAETKQTPVKAPLSQGQPQKPAAAQKTPATQPGK